MQEEKSELYLFRFLEGFILLEKGRRKGGRGNLRKDMYRTV